MPLLSLLLSLHTQFPEHHAAPALHPRCPPAAHPSPSCLCCPWSQHQPLHRDPPSLLDQEQGLWAQTGLNPSSLKEQITSNRYTQEMGFAQALSTLPEAESRSCLSWR